MVAAYKPRARDDGKKIKRRAEQEGRGKRVSEERQDPKNSWQDVNIHELWVHATYGTMAAPSPPSPNLNVPFFPRVIPHVLHTTHNP